jgi:hypothetical protein
MDTACRAPRVCFQPQPDGPCAVSAWPETLRLANGNTVQVIVERLSDNRVRISPLTN